MLGLDAEVARRGMRGTHQHSDDGNQEHDLHQTVEDEEETSDHVGDRPLDLLMRS